MKINETDNLGLTQLYKVSVGNIFKYEKEYWLRLKPSTLFPTHNIPSVRLRDGLLDHFSKECMVAEVDAVLEIK